MRILKTERARTEPQHGCALGGVLKAVVGIEGAMVLVHGPMGCESGYRFIPLLARKQPIVPSTNLTEDDIVLGTREKLQEALLRADAIICPRFIFRDHHLPRSYDRRILRGHGRGDTR